MKEEPFFSVVLTTYNRGYIIRRAIDSLTSQLMPDFEVIIIDDGSSDGTQEIIRQLVSNDERFYYFRNNENLGVVFAKNRGIQLAKGKFVTFLDSDDEYAPEHLYQRRQTLEISPTIKFLHGGVKVNGDLYVPDKDNPQNKILISKCAVGGTFIIKRDVLDNFVGFEDPALGSDAQFLNRIKELNIEIGTTDKPTYIYHHDSEQSVTNTIN